MEMSQMENERERRKDKVRVYISPTSIDLLRIEFNSHLQDVRREISEVRTEFDTKIKALEVNLKSEFNQKTSELSNGIANLQKEMIYQITGLRSETTVEFSNIKQDNSKDFTSVRKEIGDISSELAQFKEETAKEFAAIRSELAQFKEETAKEFAAIRSEFAQFKEETAKEFAAIRSEFAAIRNEIADIKNTFRWNTIGIIAALITGFTGIIISIALK